MINDSDLYGEEYFSKRAYDKRRYEAYRIDREKIYLHANHGKILDIGCGTGEFLLGFDDRFEKFGIEPSATGKKISLENGIKVLESLDDLTDDFFDVVVLRGVLQHIYNPIEVLHRAYSCLKKGGIIIILATPDSDSIGYFRWKTLPALDAPRNWIPFGHRMLNNILKRIGFKNIVFSYPYGYPYANPIRNVFNFIIGKPDAFFGNMMECVAWKNSSL